MTAIKEIIMFSLSGGFFHFIGCLTLIVIVAHVITLPITLIFKVVNRYYRTLNIKRQGWPPSHCDADGDQTEDSK